MSSEALLFEILFGVKFCMGVKHEQKDKGKKKEVKNLKSGRF